jgi:transposase
MSKKIIAHHTPAKLLELSKEAKKVKTSHRLLAIRDLLLGDSRKAVQERYGMSHDSLWRWVGRYNEQGAQGLEAIPQPGRPILLGEEDRERFKERIEAQPTYEKDGVVRWRARDIREVLEKECGAKYESLSGVRRLCHALGLSHMTTRPSHPKRDAEAVEEFKKNSPEF